MRPLKESLLFFLAGCAIVFSYLLATGAFLFATSDVFRSGDVRHSLRPSLGKTSSNFDNSNDRQDAT